MKNSTYAVAYLLRKTSMTLAEIRSLTLEQFRELFNEVTFQDSVAEYQEARYVAHILMAIANTVPRRGGGSHRLSDFLVAKAPRRAGADPIVDAHVELETLAARFGIRLPARELRDL